MTHFGTAATTSQTTLPSNLVCHPRVPGSQSPTSRGRWGWTLLGLAGCMLAFHVQAGTEGHQGGPRLRDAQRMEGPRHAEDVDRARTASRSHWQGAPLAHWARQEANWVLSIPLGANPMLDITGTHCAAHQDGPVWFLSAPVGLPEPFTKTCTVPFGQAIFVPVAAYLNDYPCPDASFQPAPGQSLDAFLAEGAAFVMSSFSSIEASLDGRTLTPRRIASRSFAFVGAKDLTPVDGCITGSAQSGVVDGYYLAIDPLPRGDHVLSIRTASNLFGNNEGSFRIQVR